MQFLLHTPEKICEQVAECLLGWRGANGKEE